MYTSIHTHTCIVCVYIYNWKEGREVILLQNRLFPRVQNEVSMMVKKCRKKLFIEDMKMRKGTSDRNHSILSWFWKELQRALKFWVFYTTIFWNKKIFLIYFFNLSFIYLFYFTILYWFCHTLTWIHHGCTCVPHPEPSSLLPPHSIPLGRPSALFGTTEEILRVKINEY